MRIIILSIALLFCAFTAQSQVLKSAGVWYFLDVDSMTARPAVLPNGTEIAYVVGTKTVYYWNRATSTWTAYGSTFNRDSIYFDASIVGSGTVSDPWGVDSTLFATIQAVGDSIMANKQTLSFASPLLGISDGNNVDLSPLLSGYVTGSGTTNYVPKWSAITNLTNSNIFDNNTYVGVISRPWKFGEYTTAGLPTGVTGYTVYETTKNGPAWYQGSRWAYGLESTANRFTTGSLIFADVNGQAAQDNVNLFWDNTNKRLGVGKANPTKLLTLFGQTGSQGFYIDKSPRDPNFWRLEKVSGGNGFIDFTNSDINISDRLALPTTGFAKIWNVQKPENAAIGQYFYSNNYRMFIHPGAGNSNAPFGGSDGADLYVMGGDSNNSDNDITGGDVYVQGGRATSKPISSSGNVILNWKDWGLVGIRTRTPTRVFDVNGVSRFRDTVLINNGLVKTTQAPIVGLNVNWAETNSVMFGENLRTNQTGSGAGPNVLFGVNILKNAPPAGGGRFSLFGDDVFNGVTTAYNVVGIGIQVADFSTSGGSDFFTGGTQVARYATNLDRSVILASLSFNRTAGIDLNQTVAFGYGLGNSNTSRSAGGAHLGYKQIPALVDGVRISTYGYEAGRVIKRGTNLSFIGNFTGATDTAFSDASAMGNYAAIGQNQSITIGAINGINSAPYDAKIGIGTVTPATKLHVVGAVKIEGMLTAIQEAYNTITSTTSPQTLSSTISDNLINQGGTQATFTLNMPASPVDGNIVMITYNNAITTLTIDGNGNTIVGSAVTTGVAGSQRAFKFYTGIGWIKLY